MRFSKTYIKTAQQMFEKKGCIYTEQEALEILNYFSMMADIFYRTEKQKNKLRKSKSNNNE